VLQRFTSCDLTDFSVIHCSGARPEKYVGQCVPHMFAKHRSAVTRNDLVAALGQTFRDAYQNHTLQMAAALSYYFVMSLFPALICLSAVLAYLMVPGVFGELIGWMGQFVPSDSMGVVKRVLSDVVSPNRGAFLSVGLLATLWTASGGVSAAMEALNMAYDVQETRPFWKLKLRAIWLTLLIGLLLLAAFGIMMAGPHFGEWLAYTLHVSRVWLLLWPILHWTASIGFTVLGIEMLYYFAPNVHQRFGATVPGAILSVCCWMILSYLLGVYFRSFANLNKTYGTLGAGIGLMVWLYWTGFSILLGAELNAELAKKTHEGPVEQKTHSSEENLKLSA
jgi:membrane protein